MWTSLLSGMGGAGVGSASGGMSGGLTALEGLGGDQFTGMGPQGGSQGLMGGMSNGMLSGLMGGGGGGGGSAAQANAIGLSSGPGGPNDMSKYANIPSLMQMVMQKEPQKPAPGQPYMGDPYTRSLMGV